MNYSQEIIDVVVEEKDRLVEQVKSKSYPFNEEEIYRYFDKYLTVKEFK
ncbi:hypothetical protein V2144_05415 [Erysipelothrix piscisicarius]